MCNSSPRRIRRSCWLRSSPILTLGGQDDAQSWLVPGVFGLRQARSIEAKRAIDAAQAAWCGRQALAAMV